MKRWVIGCMIAAATVAARAGDWTMVAGFAAANPGISSPIAGAAEYTYSPAEIPVAALPADSRDRKIVFGREMHLAWTGAIPGAHYKIRAAFLSDSDGRIQQVKVNDRVLEEKLALPKWTLLEREWAVPDGFLPGGFIDIAIQHLAGANAVLSRLEIWSDSPSRLAAPPAVPEMLAGIEQPMPRLSPRPVREPGVKTPLLSLDGTWKFNPAPPAGFETFDAAQTKNWKHIEVPGEWVMQGQAVGKNTAAAYWREFEIPADWRGRRIKLRFDTVHSECRVYVNGREVGVHEGGFTPFELDVTEAAQPGRNTLALAVKNESTADTLASATQYAAHPLGGITRKVQLFALPPASLAGQVVETRFDDHYVNATLTLKWSVADEAPKASGRLSVRATLLDGEKTFATCTREIFAGDSEISLPVAAPKKWDPEHPHLYLLKTELLAEGRVTEEISQRVGFRQVEVRGNRLFVNGTPVKLRGVCRHETDPLRGRSLTPELWRRDAGLFRAANVNYIRTSHYPPAEEFLDLCDEYGFFVECEAALCWVQHGANSTWQSWNYQDQKFLPHLLRANLENLAANRNHPCVTIWSLANESKWSPLFAEVNRRVKLADPTRPTAFHDQCWGGYNNARSAADIAVYHYPDERGPAKCDAEPRPVLFGEYCHVECYNRRELVTDPGVRDDWGRGFARMNDLMDQHDGCLGGAIWAGIDDVFCLPDGRFVGYGMWGSISDGWRREKPETWHVKKTYSPVRVPVRQIPLPAAGEPIRVPVENRYNFANLQEVQIAWDINGRGGRAQADIPARGRGEISLQPKRPPQDGDRLHLAFTDPRGFVCDEETILFGQPHPTSPAGAENPAGKLSIAESPGTIQVSGSEVNYVIDRKTGQIVSAQVRGRTFLTSGPALMLLPLQSEACEPVDLGVWKPLNSTWENWQVEAVAARPVADGAVEVTVKGASREAAGEYVLRLDAAGHVEVRYSFASRIKLNPRQWGMVFFAPDQFNVLTWDREAQWSVYPAGHIGRPSGTAVARVSADNKPYARQKPADPWPLDPTALGGNDFSSTKSGVRTASLASGKGQGRIFLASNGRQSLRAFVEPGRTGFLVTGFHTGGGDGFFSTHYAAERQPLQPGNRLADTIQLRLEPE